ncbi:MAG: tetratricopeptide repeat protein [Thermodesulfobacteriota bacterium]
MNLCLLTIFAVIPGFLQKMALRAAPLLAALLLTAGGAFAGGGATDADSLYTFAAHSYEQGNYMTAVVEFEKLLFFYPDDPRSSEAAFKIGMAHFHENRFSAAIEAFDGVIEKYPESGFSTEAAFMRSRCHEKLNDTKMALSRLEGMARRATETDVRDRAFYRIGRLHLKNGKISSARSAFAAVTPENRPHYRIEKILARLDRPRELARKNPLIAGLYSIFPGGGYVYTGRYRDALIAFAINTGMAVAAWESFDNDLPATGGMISAIGLGFYSGSIYGGINAAHKYNQRAYDDFVQSLEIKNDSNLSFHIQPRSQAVGLALQYEF